MPSLALACAWLAIAGLKFVAQDQGTALVHEREATTWLADLIGQTPSWLPTAIEASLGLALLVGLGMGRLRWLRPVAAASVVFAMVLLAISVLSEEAPRCGCFGAMSAPLRAQRIGVAGGLLCMSLLATSSVGPVRSMPAAG